MSPGAIYEAVIRALAHHASLDDEDHAAIRSLASERREVSASTYLVREGQQPQRCALLLDGFAYRQKLTVEGQRSIVSLQVPGDFINIPGLFLAESDHDVVLLTRASLIEIALADLRALIEARPAVGRAFWVASLIDASLAREWLLNVGRRDSRTRIAHLLCEASARLEASGIAREMTYELPMTQEQLGDALGLTSVHVNRVLKVMEHEQLIRRRKRELSIADWQALRRAADFNERYLHLPARPE